MLDELVDPFSGKTLRRFLFECDRIGHGEEAQEPTRRGTDGPILPDLEEFPAGEPVTLGLAEAGTFRELLALQSQGEPKRTASHFKKISGFVEGGQAGKVEILAGDQLGIRLRVTPPTLLGAMWYQLALKLSEQVLRMCPVCRVVFTVGLGTKLRADAKFCCKAHKIEFFNRNRSKKRQALKNGSKRGISAPSQERVGYKP